MSAPKKRTRRPTDSTATPSRRSTGGARKPSSGPTRRPANDGARRPAGAGARRPAGSGERRTSGGRTSGDGERRTSPKRPSGPRPFGENTRAGHRTESTEGARRPRDTSGPRDASGPRDPHRTRDTSGPRDTHRAPSAPRKRRSPGPKNRITKRTGDVRSLPDHGVGKREGRTVEGEGTSPTRAISGRAIRHLRALGHHVAPTVQVGKEGLTDALVAATKEALRAHELIKVRIGSEAPVERKEAGAELATRSGSTLVQVLGRTLLLYKRHPNKPRIDLPR